MARTASCNAARMRSRNSWVADLLNVMSSIDSRAA